MYEDSTIHDRSRFVEIFYSREKIFVLISRYFGTDHYCRFANHLSSLITCHKGFKKLDCKKR